MIGNYPITWLCTEVFSIVLITVCLFHALKQKDYKLKVFELLMFVMGAGIFEHVGVLITKTYSYDQHRILMAGKIPLSILLIEAAMLYGATTLFKYLKMPKWTSIWVVGFLTMFMDFAIDPVYVNDQYLFNGVMSGQWNWVQGYENNFVGIPFFNFTGWTYMCGYYAAMVYLGRWISEKTGKSWIKTATPFISGLFLMVPLALTGRLLVAGGDRTREIIMLALACGFAIALMIAYWKKMEPINLKEDMIIFIIPASIQAYNIVVAIVRGVTLSFIPIAVTTVIAFAYLFCLYRKAKKAQQITSK